MKGIDIFCASQASTAIRLGMDEGASSSSSTITSSSSSIHHGSGRAIDRHNPIIRDAKRIGKAAFNPTIPCSAQSPINPTPYHQNRKPNKTTTKKKSASNPVVDLKRKSVFAKPVDQSNGFFRKSFGKSGGGVDLLKSPPGSSRYLLGGVRDDQGHGDEHEHRTDALLEVLSDFDPVLTLVHVDVDGEPTNNNNNNNSKSQAQEKPNVDPSVSKSSASPPQVVVLRVSLHCKGCEGKVRKHISRMKGVTSFSIDYAAKKVTVVGDVTPLGVLASVSKIKSAQLWTPPPPPTISSCAAPPTSSDLTKTHDTIHFPNSTKVV